jgi:hypothetical protein
MYFGRGLQMFWRNVLPPSSEPKHKEAAGYSLLLACLAYSSNVKWRSVLSFEASRNFYQTTQCRVPRDGILPSDCCENLNSYILIPIHIMLSHL